MTNGEWRVLVVLRLFVTLFGAFFSFRFGRYFLDIFLLIF